jgi:hypothetical protein
MPVNPDDFSLSTTQLRQRYTNKELEDTAKLLKLYGESRYINNFRELKMPDETDPGKMDFFSADYAGAVASNIVPSTLSMITGLGQVFWSPIDTAEDVYEAGIDGMVDTLKAQYDGWENIKRTIATDPVGQLGMLAPGGQAVGAGLKAVGVGKLAGKLAQGASKAYQNVPGAVRSVTSPMGGLTAKAATMIGKPVLNMAIDPVGAVANVAYKSVKSFMTGYGAAGRIALEFITGESVQALEAMQKSGRLTQKQMDMVGLNPFHWMGEFANEAKKAEFGTSAYEHFKTARSGGKTTTDIIGGFKDEAAIIMHLDSVVLKSQNMILKQNQNLLTDIFEGLDNVDELAASGNKSALAIKFDLERKLRDPESVSTTLVTKLNKEIEDLGFKFTSENILEGSPGGKVQMVHKHTIPDAGTLLTGTDTIGLVKWIKETLDTDLSNLSSLKNALIGNDLADQAGILQKLNQYKGQAGNAELINAFYDVLRDHIDDMTPDLYRTGLDKLLPKSGELAKIMTDPTSDNMWGHAMRMQKFRDDIQKDYVSMKNGKGDDAAMLSNYIRTLRDGDSGIKKQLIDELEEITGESIHAGIAGLIARKITPSSLVARGSAVSAMHRTAAMFAGGAAFNPMVFAFIPFASPRFVGTMLSTIGLSQRSVDYAKALTRHMAKHPVGQVFNTSKRSIWSLGTVLDKIQSYNDVHMQQPQLEERY